MVWTLECTQLPLFPKGGNRLRWVCTLECRSESHSKGNKNEKSKNFKFELFVTGDGKNEADSPAGGRVQEVQSNFHRQSDQAGSCFGEVS